MTVQRPPQPLPGVAGHIQVLDGVRGAAILLVLVRHLTLPFVPAGGPDVFVQELGQVGWAGVDLFFVLSGFLITGILYDARGGAGYFRNFYMRRALRIFPLYYACLVVLFVGLPLLGAEGRRFDLLQANQAWYWTYSTNLLIGLRDGETPLYTAHFWSLAVEEQFYLVWPAVVFALDWRRLARACLLCIAGAVAFRCALLWAGGSGLANAIYVLTPGRLDALGLGGLLALAVRRPEAWRAVLRWRHPLALAAFAFLAWVFVARDGIHRDDPVVLSIGFSAFAVIFAALLVGALVAPASSPLARAFGSRALTFLGRYSYAIYIVHYPVIGAVVRWIPPERLPLLFGSRLPAHLLLSLLAVTLSVGISLASWHLLEKHFLALKRRFPSSARPTAAGAGVAWIADVEPVPAHRVSTA